MYVQCHRQVAQRHQCVCMEDHPQPQYQLYSLGLVVERMFTLLVLHRDRMNVDLTIYIGGFNNWKEKIPLNLSEKDFTLIQYLPPGTYQYKFIVDGKWVHANDQPIQTGVLMFPSFLPSFLSFFLGSFVRHLLRSFAYINLLQI